MRQAEARVTSVCPSAQRSARRWRMRTLFLFLSCSLLVLAAEGDSPVRASACRPGGFALIDFGNLVARAKADSNFNVILDPAAYQGNGFDESLRSAMSTWSAVSGSNWRYNFTGYNSAVSDVDGKMSVVKGGGFSFPPGVLAATLTTALTNGQIVDAD